MNAHEDRTRGGAEGSEKCRNSELASWQTAVQYQLFHSVTLLALGLFADATGLVLTPWRWLGPVTPLGGLLLIAGWASLLLLARSE